MCIREYVRRVLYIICGLVFTGSLLGAQVSGAATYYAATNGSDSHSCPQAQNQGTPKRTINAGLNCLSGGDTLTIESGTYIESIGSGAIPSGSSESARTVIKAEKIGTVTLKPSGVLRVVEIGTSGQYITLDGLVLDGTNLGGSQQSRNAIKLNGDVGVGAHHITLQNLAITNPTNFCVGAGGYSHVLSNVRVSNCGLETNDSFGDVGIYWAASNSLLERLYVTDTTGAGIQFYESGNDPHSNTLRNSIFYRTGRAVSNRGGIAVYGTRNKIYNNVVYQSAADGITLQRGGNMVRNNISYGNNNRQIFDNASSNTLSHNLCTGHASCIVTTDPKFVNAAGGNLQLRSDSPAINKGIALSEVASDHDGVPRPQEADYDIGAYEYKRAPSLLSPTNLKITSLQ